MENLLGTTIGNYQVVEKLGRGGMANVYKAYHPGLAVHRALKVIRPELVGEQGFSDRFQLEARAVAGLRHPNIVQVHDFGQHESLFYMVMEFVEGENLRDRIQREGPIRPFTEALRIVEQLAAGLGFAHENNVLHRDVKPENILLSTDGQAILADFGIAKMLASTDPKLTATGIGIGTPAYMAPELAMGSTELTPAADLYAVGVVLYESLTAHSPFVADTPLAVLQRVIHDPVPAPREFTADIPDALQGVVLKSMAKNPTMRYPNAAAFIEACRQSMLGMGPDQLPQGGTPAIPPLPPSAMLQDHPTTPMPKAAVAATPAAVAAPTPGSPHIAATTPAASPGQRSRTPFVALAIVAFLLLALCGGAILGGWWWFSSRTSQGPERLANRDEPSASSPVGAVAVPAAPRETPPVNEAVTGAVGATGGVRNAAGSDGLTPAVNATHGEMSAPSSQRTAREASRGGSTAVKLAEPSSATRTAGSPAATNSQGASAPPSPGSSEAMSPPAASAASSEIGGASAPESANSGPRIRAAEEFGQGAPASPTEPATRFAGTLRFGRSTYGEAEPDEIVEYELELRRPTTLFFDVVSANRRGTYTLFDPDGEIIFRQQGNDFGPLRLETAGWYNLTVEAEGNLPLEFEVNFVRTGS